MLSTSGKEDHKSFLGRFTLKVTPNELERLDFAYDLSKYSHRNQFRESGERYFEHLRASALIMVDELGIMDLDLVISTLLHDTIEDGFLLTSKRIRIVFGERVALITETVSKPSKNDPRFKSSDQRNSYYLQVIRGSDIDTKLIKLCDRLHNLRTLENCSIDKQTRKIQETRNHYLSLIEDVKTVYQSLGEKLEKLFTKALAELERE